MIITCILNDRQITWAECHFRKLHFEDDAVGNVSHALHGAVPEAEDFNRLETAAPDVRRQVLMNSFLFLRKEKKELS